MTIPSWVHPGARCVALYSFPDAVDEGFDAPVRGCVYTVREIDTGPGIYDCIRLVEITNPLCNDGWEPSWVVSRFKPAVTLRQDIRRIKSALRDMPITERLDRFAELLDQEEK